MFGVRRVDGHRERQRTDVTGKAPFDRDVHTVFQDYAFFPHLSALRNVEHPLRVRKVGRAERRQRALEALGIVQLAAMADRAPTELSGGQRQRVALARALVDRPSVLLLDEPLGALDLKLREQMQLELKQIQRTTGITFVLVTHDQDEALTLADRIVVFADGRVEQAGPAREVLAFVYVPLALVLLNSFNASATFAFPPSGLTLRWWAAAVENAGVRDAVWLSVRVALLATGIAVVLLHARRRALDVLHRHGRQHRVGAVAPHVTFPALRGALVAGALLAFALSFDEVIVTTFTAGPGLQTLPLWILQNLFRAEPVPDRQRRRRRARRDLGAAGLPGQPALGGHRGRHHQVRSPWEPSMETFHNIVDGKPVPAADGRTLDITDPSTGEVYATSPLSGPADVDAAYSAARRAFDEGWRDITPSERMNALLEIADTVAAHADELVELEARDTGKPKGLTRSEEVDVMVDQFRFFAGAARNLGGRAGAEYMAGHTS
jgi:ABC-type thiamine transport system ATPase subunit